MASAYLFIFESFTKVVTGCVNVRQMRKKDTLVFVPDFAAIPLINDLFDFSTSLLAHLCSFCIYNGPIQCTVQICNYEKLFCRKSSTRHDNVVHHKRCSTKSTCLIGRNKANEHTKPNSIPRKLPCNNLYGHSTLT